MKEEDKIDVKFFLQSTPDLPNELKERINSFLLKLDERKKSLAQ